MKRALFCAVLANAAAAQTPIDFSYAGFGGGGIAPPVVNTVITLRASGGDDTAAIQAAIDRAGASAPGAVQLEAGLYRVGGHLVMPASGVVLRGSGDVTLEATGKSRRTLIEIGGSSEPRTAQPIAVIEDAPAGARSLAVGDASAFHRGDRIVITRPSTAEWITALHMRGLPGTYANQRLDWAPGSRNLVWDRIVERVEGSKITVDAPITTALEKRYGGGTIALVTAIEPVSYVGIDNLTIVSDSAPGHPKDEDHSWIAIALDHVEDAWVRGVTMRGFAGSAVRIGPRARRITIERCRAEKPASEPAGYRRQNFLVEGQQVLVSNSSSEGGMNDFATGLLAAGPNVFLNDTAIGSLGPSGPFESWASGVLYENVKIAGSGIRLTNDSSRAEGAGWTAANSVIWNSKGDYLEAKGPEGAENVAQNSPEPLFETQLSKRLGERSAPVSLAFKPSRPAVPRNGLDTKRPAQAERRITIVNGRFVMDGRVLWGGMINDGWWRGHEDPAVSLDVGGNALTRFVPGRVGPGLTEDLNALTQKMLRENTPFYQMVPGLWYDRRRDEHSINSREDSNVWAPFYEMPWARSGVETASDGLSKFDLTKFNPWYFDRLKEFGQLASAEGFVLYYNLYNMHNTLEIPPHWVDYPWRPANNINHTGLPEPPPIVNGRELHVGNEVYDISNPARRELHRALILHVAR